jgi:hypothetical protein
MADATSEIALSRRELESPLPPVCLCCGAPAVTTRSKSFWRNTPIQAVPTVGVFGAIRVLMQVSDALAEGGHVLQAPWCEKHRNYWAGDRFILIARLGMIGLFVIGLILAAVLALTAGTGWAIAWALLCVLGLGVAAGFILHAQRDRIAQLEPNSEFLLLGHVSATFVDAMHRRRQELGAAVPSQFAADQLASLRKKQRKLQIWNVSVLPAFGIVALTLVVAILACLGPPTNLPLPAGGPQTRGTDLHCYDLLKRGNVSQEARSALVWNSKASVEGWDHAATLGAVERLYALGARRVYYHPVLLLVILPEDPATRQRLFQWVFVEVKKRQGEPTPDEGQKYLMVSPN